MYRSTAVVAMAFFVLVGGCEKQPKADPAAAKNAIEADQKSWNDQFKAKDTAGIVGHYADDAYFVAPGIKPADGSTAIRELFANSSTDPNFAVTIASDKVDVAASGDMAYARGHFTEKYTDPKTSKEMTTSGQYLTVYRKQKDGSWKAVEDFAAADPDATKPVPPQKPATRATMTSF